MAKSKSQKSKSSSATIGFEQQIWDAACELFFFGGGDTFPLQIIAKSLQDLSS